MKNKKQIIKYLTIAIPFIVFLYNGIWCENIIGLIICIILGIITSAYTYITMNRLDKKKNDKRKN